MNPFKKSSASRNFLHGVIRLQQLIKGNACHAPGCVPPFIWKRGRIIRPLAREGSDGGDLNNSPGRGKDAAERKPRRFLQFPFVPNMTYALLHHNKGASTPPG